MQVSLKHCLLVLAGALVCIGTGTIWTHRVRATSPGKSETSVERAAVAVVKRRTVANALSIAGEFLPYQEVELHAKVSGYIRQINVDIGDHVRTGQVLAILEVPELTAQVVGADATVRHSHEEILRAQNEVSRAQAAHDALHAAALRLQQASDARPGLIAAQELDDATAKDRASEAQIEAAKSALAAANQQLDVSRASQSQVAAMQAYSRIVAPFDGVVTWRYADTGSLIQAGTSNSSSMPVVKVAQVDTLRLRIPVPDSLTSSIQTGSPADIQVQATGEHLKGKIARTTGALDRTTRTMQVEIEIQNKNYKLAPGMYANVNLQVQNRTDALAVPIEAVLHDGAKNEVLLLDSSNRIHLQNIQTGIESSAFVEVLRGVQSGDRVIVGNLASFQPGQVVDPKLSSLVGNSESEGASE